MRPLLIVALVVSLALSGCTYCEEGPPVTARNINNALASGGVGGYDLDVLLTDGPGGAPLPDAGVVVYWTSTTTEEWDGPAITIGQDEVSAEPASGSQSVEASQTIRLKSDGDGMVRANPPAERIVGLVAAKEDFTEEWLPALATGERGGGDVLTVPLYRQTLEIHTNDTWGPGAASSGIATSGGYEWKPVEAAFGDSDEARRGYAARIVQLEITLTWTNDQNGAGDLGIGIGPDPGDGPTFFHDDDENLGSGLQTESVILSAQELVDHNILSNSPIQIGPATKSGFVGPFGLPYTLDIEARFDTALADLKMCQGGSNIDDSGDNIGVGAPSPAVPLLVAAMVALAVMVRRRN